MQRFTIFGKQSCGFCRQAKAVCEQKQLPFRYVDIVEEGIGQADLEATVGKPVTTVPQIFYGQKYIGGFEDFSRFVAKEFAA